VLLLLLILAAKNSQRNVCYSNRGGNNIPICALARLHNVKASRELRNTAGKMINEFPIVIIESKRE
jgi:hypothetical protein